jgi:hypothetical protein
VVTTEKAPPGWWETYRRDPPISTLIAGQINKTTAWYQTMAVDACLRLLAMANTPEDFQAKIVSIQEVFFLDASIFPGLSIRTPVNFSYVRSENN